MDNKSIEQLLGRKFLRKKSYLSEKDKENGFFVEDCGLEDIVNTEFTILYFSASWCTPCEQFTQVLKDFYSELNIDHKAIEVVYVSCDKDEEGFKDGYKKMPWLTFPWKSEMHSMLRKQFDIIGVPLCIVCESKTGFVITKKGRVDIFDLGVGAMKSWRDSIP